MIMIGEVYINDKDIYVNYSARLIDDSFASLVIPANPKEYASNDLRSQPGTQYFISNIQPQERSVQITVFIKCDTLQIYLSALNRFVEEINKGMITLKVVPLKTVYKLFVDSYISLDPYMGGSAGKLIIKLKETNPKDRIQL